MQVIECWDVQTWDGADRHNHSFYVKYEEDKNTYLSTNRYDTAYKVKLVICDTLDEVGDFKAMQARDRALAKLTPDDRKALGL